MELSNLWNPRRAQVDAGPPGWRALRDRHGGLVKPDIVFFGEGLPRRFFDLASRDLPRCKLLLVVGTSLSVQPFASLVGHVGDDCVRVLVNRDPVGRRDPRIPLAVARQLGIGGGLEFDDPVRNYRDVALLGSCDDVVWDLAKSLGWEDDLARLVRDAQAAFLNAPQRRVVELGAPPPPRTTTAQTTFPLPDAPLPTPRDDPPPLQRAESASAQLAALVGLSCADASCAADDGHPT